MARPVTLFTAQWGDMESDRLARKASDWGYDGLELACRGGHFAPSRGAQDRGYCDSIRSLLDKHGLNCWALSVHRQGQCVLDRLDQRHDGLVPDELAGRSEKIREWAIETVKNAARAARNMGIEVVTGFTGSPVWHTVYPFPPLSPNRIDEGFALMAERWNPILDVFEECGVRFALEVHPTEMAFDLYTAERVIEALNARSEIGFNLDPSHLHWQGVDPVEFIRAFHDRIYHVHMKDAAVTLDGRSGLLCSHLDFGDPRRGWDFRSPGRGEVDFEGIIRALNRCSYQGPLSVEWEDNGMERERGAREACRFVRAADFRVSSRSFDEAFDE